MAKRLSLALFGVVLAFAPRTSAEEEPRAALDVWVSKTSTLTVWAGTNLRHPSESLFGLAMSFHTAPFDGKF